MDTIWIIDDEIRQCRGLTNLMRETYPQCEVSFFTEAHAVLEALSSRPVQLVITDIRMPLLDGLELAQIILQRSPKTHIILLTGFAEFSYAQKAVSLGVAEYLLKPLDYDELIQSVSRVQRKMRREQQEAQEREALKSKLSQTLPIYEEQTLNQWVLGMLPLAQCSLACGLVANEPAGSALALTVRKPKGLSAEEHDKGMEQVLLAARAFWGLRQNSLFVRSQLQDDRIIGLVTTRLAVEKASAQSLLLPELIQHIRQESGRDVMVSLGNMVPHLGTQVQQSYTSATEALDFGFYLGWNRALYSYNLLPRKTRFSGTSLAEEDFIREAIRSNNKKNATTQMDSIFQRFTSYGYPDPMELKQGVLSLLRRVSQFVQGSFSTEEWGVLQGIMEEDLLSSLDYTTFRQLTHGFLEMFAYAVSRNEEVMEQRLVQEFWAYLDTHYPHDISLEDISAHFDLTPNYFSNLIASLTGQGFVKNLNAVRLYNAKRMLGENDRKIYEIAASTGFRDARYFTRVFKQGTGLTPEQYRRQLLVQRGRP